MIQNGKYSHGRKVAEFESALAAYTGAAHVVGVNSGTDALVLLLRACGLRPGDEVVVPAFSFVASASSVVLAGGRPVFADIEPDGYGLGRRRRRTSHPVRHAGAPVPPPGRPDRAGRGGPPARPDRGGGQRRGDRHAPRRALLDASDDEVVSALAAEAERFVPGLRAAVTGSVVHRFRHGLPEATPHAPALRGEFASRLGGVVDSAGDRVSLSPYSEAAVRSGRRAAARVHAVSPKTGTRRQTA